MWWRWNECPICCQIELPPGAPTGLTQELWLELSSIQFVSCFPLQAIGPYTRTEICRASVLSLMFG
jgi:hypothetical protein